MGRLLALLIGITILMSGSPAWASPLSERVDQWPGWSLPGPLKRPSSKSDLIFPDWFEGLWEVNSIDVDAPEDAPLTHQARFVRDRRGRLVSDRSFNALAIGKALLGDQLLRVEDDPETANRQIAKLKDDQRLETTVTGRRQETPDAATFLADELVLQIMHAPGPPRLSRIETLSRYSRCGDEICADQWQGRYAPPGETLRSPALDHHHFRLRFRPLPESAPSV